MGDVTFLQVAWFVVTFVVGAMMFAAQIGPKAAVSNLSDWTASMGVTAPKWLRSPAADRAVRFGGPFALAILAMLGVWIFWSLGDAVYTGCAELIGFALFALRRRSRTLGIALTVISFIALGVGLWIVVSSKTDGLAKDASAALVRPGNVNSLQEAVEVFLAKQGKKAGGSRADRSADSYKMEHAPDGKGPFISSWGSNLGPSPTVADGFTEYQLRKLAKPNYVGSIRFAGGIGDNSVTRLEFKANDYLDRLRVYVEFASSKNIASDNADWGPKQKIQLADLRDVTKGQTKTVPMIYESHGTGQDPAFWWGDPGLRSKETISTHLSRARNKARIYFVGPDNREQPYKIIAIRTIHDVDGVTMHGAPTVAILDEKEIKSSLDWPEE